MEACWPGARSLVNNIGCHGNKRGDDNNYPIKLIVVFAKAFLFLLLLTAPSYGDERQLNIIYTGSLQGQLEPCGCSPKTDFGGVARISGYLTEHERSLSPYILLDAGNFSDKDTAQGRLKIKAMLKFFSLMEYNTLALWGRESRFDQDFLRSLLGKYNVPVVSGLKDSEHSLTIGQDKLNINVSAYPEGFKDEMLNILLTELTLDKAKLLKGWDLIITSSGEELEEPVRVDGTVLVSGYPKGKKLGILTMKTDGQKMLGFTHRWVDMGKEIKEDERARKVLNDYDKEVARLLAEAEKPETGTTYVGVAKCSECHQPFEESWKETAHAKAFATLESAGKSADPECLICHTVGYGEEGGFFSVETTPELKNVQCEVCHGLDREHLTDFSRPMQPVTETVCLKCHTESNSPDFDYPLYLEKIKHW